jgi:hypothetical protein
MSQKSDDDLERLAHLIQRGDATDLQEIARLIGQDSPRDDAYIATPDRGPLKVSCGAGRYDSGNRSRDQSAVRYLPGGRHDRRNRAVAMTVYAAAPTRFRNLLSPRNPREGWIG